MELLTYVFFYSFVDLLLSMTRTLIKEKYCSSSSAVEINLIPKIFVTPIKPSNLTVLF